jgi:hypothetical protein
MNKPSQFPFRKTALSVAILTALGLGANVNSEPSATYTPILDDPITPEKENLNEAGKITFKQMQVELYNPMTDEPTGEYAVFAGGNDLVLDVLPGYQDTRIPEETINNLNGAGLFGIASLFPPEVTPPTIDFTLPVCTAAQLGGSMDIQDANTGESINANYASIVTYSAAQETLCIPSLKVENMIVLPGGDINIVKTRECYEVVLKTSTTQPDVLKVENMFRVSFTLCNN